MAPSPSSSRQLAIILLKEGMSVRVVAQRFSISKSTVARWRAKEEKDIPRSVGGRPRKLTLRDSRIIARHAIIGQIPTATALQKHLEQRYGLSAHRTTVARSLKRSGLGSFAKRKKALLSAKHRNARLKFAREHLKWTEANWSRVFFSDETKINLWNSDGRQYCWKKRGDRLRDQHVVSTLKHGGGSIMIWSCFCAAGPGYVCRIDGAMNAKDYKGILKSDLLDSMKYYADKVADPIFQQDNDSKHTAKSTLKWLDKQSFEVVEWPSQSPDLNPIERLWAILKRRLGEYPTKPRNRDELWERVVKTWDAISTDECAELIKSMPARMTAVIKAKGGYTRY